MALTITQVSRKVRGDRTIVVADAVWDSSATAGGEAVVASDFGLKVIDAIQPTVARDPDTVDNAVLVVFDSASSTLIPFYGDYSNASDGPLIEAATVDLSAYTSRLVVEGY